MAVTEGGEPPVDPPPEPAEADLDFMITTVVAGNEGTPPEPPPPAIDLDDASGTVADVPAELLWLVGELNTTRKAATDHSQRLVAIDGRLAAVEALPASLDALGRATRQELERCAGVLFAHDRALHDTRDRLDAIAARLDALDVGPAQAAALRANDAAIQAHDEAVARILEQLDGLTQRLAVVEARVEPLEAVPTIVQALRRAVRANDDLLAGEAGARQRDVAALAGEVAAEAQARDDALRRLVAQDLDRVAGIAAASTQRLDDVAERLTAAEDRLAPLDSLPADVEALSRILRRELDAVTADNQARDQVLRRALQNEIDQLHAATEGRDTAAAAVAARLEVAEKRLVETTDDSAAAASRIDGLEGRMSAADAWGAQLDALRADARAHDQVLGEITRAFAALDSRLARVDPVPGELQSLRTALRQESERSVNQLRAVEERLGQLAWVPGEFQEARKRILSLTSGLQVDQDAVKSLEAAVASLDDRLRALTARLGTAAAPGPPA